MKSALINVFLENLTEKAKEVYTALAFFYEVAISQIFPLEQY